MKNLFSWASILVLGLTIPVAGFPDAIVKTNAMLASTIAEYFVEEDGVRVELEIGMSDLGAFRNLLPDQLYSEMGFGEVPLSDRIGLVTSRDLAILADGQPLGGRITKMGPETRVQRDRVTGEPIPASEGQEPEIVIRVSLFYPLETLPESMVINPPGETGLASVGFVLYHEGVAVNDFRYLSAGAELKLDWEDPWYSQFTLSALRRTYYAPMAGFIYVEPFEVRKEIIVRPKDIQQYVDLGLDGRDTIPPEMQQAVKDGIVGFLADHFPVEIDGQPVAGEIDRVNFLQRSLRSSLVVDGQEVDLLPASVGVIYVFPTDGLPQIVEMEWDIFSEQMQMVPASSVDQAGPLPTFLEPDFNVLKWENFLRFPELPELTDLRQPPTTLQGSAQWARWAFGGVGLLFLFVAVRAGKRTRAIPPIPIVLCVLAVAAAAWSEKTWRETRLDPERLQSLVGGLLHNVYRAFDRRGEEVIYDVLARSVSGDLLADVFLETRRGLELENQGGASVKVKDIEVLDTRLVDDRGEALDIEARWNVSGSIGHWGHVHQRINGYHANLSLENVEGAWKLSALEILEEQRLGTAP